MKKQYFLLCLVFVITVLAVGCGAKQPEEPVLYSNLTEESVRFDLDSLMRSAGFSDHHRAVFFEHVDQINEIMKPEQLTHGFEALGEPKYDPYAVQDAWTAKHPEFLGYNCRITAFSLFAEHLLAMPEDVPVLDDNMILLDLDALQTDSSADIPLQKFRAFYSNVPTEMTKDVNVHAEALAKSWHDRGIEFIDDPAARLISVVFHAEGDPQSYLFIGHTGILLPTPDGDYWFMEKLSFQEPYQVVKFQNREQLSRYLMKKYDLDQNQPVAKPFIMENDVLMK